MGMDDVYRKLFRDNPLYNNHANDLARYDFVLRELSSARSLIDISSGRGYLLGLVPGHVVITSTDIEKFHSHPCEFIPLNLNYPDEGPFGDRRWDVLSCLDVLEHIPEVSLESSLRFMRKLASKFCFSIANHSDVIGGVELHLIQRDERWWIQKLEPLFDINSVQRMYGDKLYQFVATPKKVPQ